MTTNVSNSAYRDAVAQAVTAACQRIAPSWPLDRFVAVNPYWGWIDHPIERLDGRLQQLAGSPLHMPRRFYRHAWCQGRVGRGDLRAAIGESGSDDTPEGLVAELLDTEPEAAQSPLLSDGVDARRDLSHQPAWSDAIVQQISQFTAKFFDADQAEWPPAPRGRLFTDWRESLIHNHAISVLMGTREVRRRAAQLPTEPDVTIQAAVDALGVPDDELEALFVTCLLRISGWASWCAYRDWQGPEGSAGTEWRRELLAIRLAWELLLDDGERSDGSVWAEWQRAWQTTPPPGVDETAWLWQRALEIAYQRPLAERLAGQRAPGEPGTPAAQTVFCIDVRSELFRRSLETADPAIQTLGFAGFFGVPAAYRPLGTDADIPLLPGLLSPSMTMTDTCGDAMRDAELAENRRQALARGRSGHAFAQLPASGFARVETLGLKYIAPLIRQSLAWLDPRGAGALPPSPGDARPRLAEGPSIGHEHRIDLAETVLRGMGLRDDFARLIALIGHGSESANNPHASALDCGACAGQSGQLNAQALAAVLNATDVRQGLAERGWTVPETTYFIAGLHNTTTDEATLLETDLLPASHDADRQRLERALADAGARARAERAPTLRLGHLADQPERLRRALRRRARDWAQTRPEWGLADNAAMVIGPRSRTRGLDLGSQVFLHEYDCRLDADGEVLASIMTAPMVVAHWINMQYYASTVDNNRWGCGNKTLHNVVSGRIGVFEGNAGDLRIGLAMQSLHDGEQWRHIPRRLGVFIEAPRAAIEGIIQGYDLVQTLVTNGWLSIYRIDPETGDVEAYSGGVWHAWVTAQASAHAEASE